MSSSEHALSNRVGWLLGGFSEPRSRISISCATVLIGEIRRTPPLFGRGPVLHQTGSNNQSSDVEAPFRAPCNSELWKILRDTLGGFDIHMWRIIHQD